MEKKFEDAKAVQSEAVNWWKTQYNGQKEEKKPKWQTMIYNTLQRKQDRETPPHPEKRTQVVQKVKQ
jgi:hypothetical protein